MLLRSRTAGSVSGILCTAIALVVCAFLLPGTTIDGQGLLIAIAVIDLPTIITDRYIARWQGSNPLRFMLGGLFIFPVWMLASPAIADWVTPHFNIGGIWQYAALVLLDIGLAAAYSKIITTFVADPDLS